MRTTRAFELASVPLLRALPPDRLGHLAAFAVHITVPARQPLPSAGNPIDAFYVIRRGCLALEARGPEGQRMLFGLVGPGDTLGEQHLIPTHAQRFSAVALERSVLIRLPLKRVRAAFASAPAASWILAEVLTMHVQRTHRTIQSLGTMTVAQRVAAQLCELASLVGTPHPTGAITLGLHLTHDLLADLVGATRESVTRALATFRRLGWITTGRGTCVLTDLRSLETHASG